MILVLLGIPVCAALFVGSITYAVVSLAAGEPLESGDWFGVAAFGGLSLVVVLLAMRAFKKKKESVAPAIAYAAPVLLVVGGLAGLVITSSIMSEHFENVRAIRGEYCREILGEEAGDDSVKSCVAIAADCAPQARNDPKGLTFSSAMRRCLKARLGALQRAGAANVPSADDSAAPDVKPVYPTDAGEIPEPVKRLCDALHGLPKRRRAECCEKKPGIVVTSECERNLAGAIKSGGVRLGDPAACEAAMTAAHKGCGWVGPYPVNVPEACRTLVEGLREAGDVCRSSLECAAGSRCVGAGPTDTGKCGPPSPIGGVCNTAVDPLAVYLRQDDIEASHPSCDGGFCDRNRCRAKLAGGADCTANVQCEGRCAGGKCVADTVAQVGEPCLGGDCAEGARCVERKCLALKDLGEPCRARHECKADCVDGTCKPGCDVAPLLKKLR